MVAPIRLGALDVSCPRALVSATEQNHDRVAISTEVDSIARPDVDLRTLRSLVSSRRSWPRSPLAPAGVPLTLQPGHRGERLGGGAANRLGHAGRLDFAAELASARPIRAYGGQGLYRWCAAHGRGATARSSGCTAGPCFGLLGGRPVAALAMRAPWSHRTRTSLPTPAPPPPAWRSAPSGTRTPTLLRLRRPVPPPCLNLLPFGSLAHHVQRFGSASTAPPRRSDAEGREDLAG